MLEVTDSQLTQYILHHVSDSPVFGDEVFERPEVLLEAAFTQLAFTRMNYEQQYEFFHETDLGLNEVFTYVDKIFNTDGNFLEQSKNIATHLQSVSAHPNIKSGELFIGLFENCLWGSDMKRALAIVKIDEKEIFLDVKNDASKMIVNGIDGINVKKNNHVCIIVDMGPDETPAVFMKTRKKEDLVYWQERFLKIKVADEKFHNTNLALTECRKIILREDNFSNTEKLSYLNKTLDYFRNEEEFQVSDYLDTVFEGTDVVSKELIANSVTPYETIISESAIEKAEKTYKRKIKLDEHVEIQVNVRDIDEVDEIIEVGFDEATNRKFYKIYFDEET